MLLHDAQWDGYLTMGPREELREIIASQSLLTREEGYTLASGKRSPYYFDLKLTTLSSPRALFLAARLILDKINALPAPVDAIGGLTSGADPLVIAVSQLAMREGRILPALFVRDEQKAHGTQRVIEGTVRDGMKVVILDDVITTGNSVLKAIQPVEKKGAQVVHVFILVDREEGGIELLREQHYNVDPLFTYSELRSCGAVPRSSS
jgi:orotate phosphoribosyltransferase